MARIVGEGVRMTALRHQELLLAAVQYSIWASQNASRYPTDAPYTATLSSALPAPTVAGDILLLIGCVNDRGPLDYSSSILAQLEDCKIVPLAAERTDGQYIGYRICDGTESGTPNAVWSDGAHDWLGACILIRGPGPLAILSHASACARLGALTLSGTAAMTGPSGVSVGVGNLVFAIGSVSSTGAAAPGGIPGPSYPSVIASVVGPDAHFTEYQRVTDNVDEVLTCWARQFSTALTGQQFNASCIVPLADTYFGFMATLVIGLASPPPAYASWNPADINTNAALSVGNTKLQNGIAVATAAARSTAAVTGKVYVESTISMVGGTNLTISIGVSRSSVTMNTSFDTGGTTNTAAFVASTAGARIYMNNTRLLTGDTNLSGTTSSTVTVGIAINATTGDVWIRDVAHPTVWFGGGDPVAGTTPSFTLTGTGPILIAAADDEGIISATKYVLFTGDPTGYAAAPSGFTAGMS